MGFLADAPFDPAVSSAVLAAPVGYTGWLMMTQTAVLPLAALAWQRAGC